jgi:energy-converting hydrogenase Eha subunit E
MDKSEIMLWTGVTIVLLSLIIYERGVAMRDEFSSILGLVCCAPGFILMFLSVWFGSRWK